MADPEVERFRDLAARVGEKYADFVIMVRDSKNRLIWKSSERSWAIGAMSRYINSLDEWDREEDRRAIENDNG